MLRLASFASLVLLASLLLSGCGAARVGGGEDLFRVVLLQVEISEADLKAQVHSGRLGRDGDCLRSSGRMIVLPRDSEFVEGGNAVRVGGLGVAGFGQAITFREVSVVSNDLREAATRTGCAGDSYAVLSSISTHAPETFRVWLPPR